MEEQQNYIDNYTEAKKWRPGIVFFMMLSQLLLVCMFMAEPFFLYGSEIFPWLLFACFIFFIPELLAWLFTFTRYGRLTRIILFALVAINVFVAAVSGILLLVGEEEFVSPDVYSVSTLIRIWLFRLMLFEYVIVIGGFLAIVVLRFTSWFKACADSRE